MSAASWRQAMEAGLQTMRAEGGGVISVFVVRPTENSRLLGSALAGNAESAKVFRAVCVAHDNIKQAPRRKPMLCASCPRPLRQGRYAVVVAIPACEAASQGLTLAVCTRCATEPAEIGQKALHAFRRFCPEARAFFISHPGAGHA